MDTTTEEIRRQADIVEIVGQHVTLKPSGPDRWKACCPFHDEKTPSFYVSRDKGFYKCFGCLHERELIWTRNGLQPIGAIMAGDEVLDRHGSWQSVLATEHKNGELWEVETRAFRHDPLWLTPDHTCLFVRQESALASLPYLYRSHTRGTRFKSAYKKSAYRNGELRRPVEIAQDRADAMRDGDFLVFPVIPPSARFAAPLRREGIIRPYTAGKKVARVASLPVNARAARLFGFYLAEGSVAPRGVWWTFHLDEEKTLAAEVVELLCEQFGLPSSIHLNPRKRTCTVICSKTDLAAQFFAWFGKSCAHKKLPAEALEWPPEVQRALIAAYQQGDGNARGDTKTTSQTLAYGLFALSIQAGLLPSLSRCAARRGADGTSHAPFWFSRHRDREGLAGFYEKINGQTYFWSQIRRVRSCGTSAKVVDISVANSESFVTKLGMVHNCGVSGDVFKFVQAVENLTFPEAKRQLAERFGIAIRPSRDISPEEKTAYDERDKLYKIMAAATAFFREQFAGNGGLIARDYARERGLSRATIEKFGIGYAPDAWDGLRLHLTKKYGFEDKDCAEAGLLVEKKGGDAALGGIFEESAPAHYYDRYRHRLMFPIWDERGRVVAFGGRALEGGKTGNPDAKYINSPEGTLFHKSRILYAFHIARPEVPKREAAIVTEGYMDAIALHEGGLAHTVATLGTALTVQHVQLLRRLSPKIVYLCYDGDSAGMQAALRAGPLFSSHSLDVRVVSLPGGDDPDTFIRKNGKDAFEKALHDAKFLGQYRLEMAIREFDLSEVAGRMEAVRAASEIIAEVQNPTERDAYAAWLSEQWSRAEGITAPARFAMVEAAVRREIEGAGKRQRSKANLPVAVQASIAAREVDNQDLSETLSTQASGQQSGVIKAERGLLSVLLNAPSWRARILEELPPQQWTQEIHAEIALAMRDVPANEPVEIAALLEQLSTEAGGLVGELMMSDESQAADDAVIKDFIGRVRGHWARQVEIEMKEYITLKAQRGELTREDMARFDAALIAVGRKSPPKPT